MSLIFYVNDIESYLDSVILIVYFIVCDSVDFVNLDIDLDKYIFVYIVNVV